MNNKKNYRKTILSFCIIFTMLLSISNIESKNIESNYGWDLTFGTPGTEGEINDIIEFDIDNDSIDEYVFGGYFTEIGGIEADNIAYWDPVDELWGSMGEVGDFYGLPEPVGALEVIDLGCGPFLLAGGSFTFPAGYYGSCGLGDLFFEDFLEEETSVLLAAWMKDDPRWRPVLKTDDSSVVEDIIIYPKDSNEFYVGGRIAWIIPCCQQIEVFNLVHFDNGWHKVGQGTESVPGNCVFDMEIYQGELYVGGDFDFVKNYEQVELAYTIGIARWDGDEWSSVGNGIKKPDGMGDPGYVISLSAYDDGSGEALFAGGMFECMNQTDPVEVHNIARWDVTGQWQPLQNGENNKYIGLPEPVYAMTSFEENPEAGLIVGGDFEEAGGATVNHITKWKKDEWYELNGGVTNDPDGKVSMLHTNQTQLFVGGVFASVDNPPIPSFNIARWFEQPPSIPGNSPHIDNNDPAHHLGNIQLT